MAEMKGSEKKPFAPQDEKRIRLSIPCPSQMIAIVSVAKALQDNVKVDDTLF